MGVSGQSLLLSLLDMVLFLLEQRHSQAMPCLGSQRRKLPSRLFRLIRTFFPSKPWKVTLSSHLSLAPLYNLASPPPQASCVSQRTLLAAPYHYQAISPVLPRGPGSGLGLEGGRRLYDNPPTRGAGHLDLPLASSRNPSSASASPRKRGKFR